MLKTCKLFFFICLLSIVFALAVSFAAVKARDFNVIIVCIDSLRPDHLGCYGYNRDTSSNIDTLAGESVRFSSAIAAGDWTIESVPSILTGTYPLTHQIKYFNSLRNPDVKTIAQQLSERGYLCDFWTNYPTLSLLDVKDGFKNFNIVYKSNEHIVNAGILTAHIVKKLKTEYKTNRFFLYIHYDGCHVPYDPPARYKNMYLNDKYRKPPQYVPISNADEPDERYEGIGKIPNAAAERNITDKNYYIATYDGAIRYMDGQIGMLLNALRESGLDRNTVFILTADHAEMLGEHNFYFSHGKAYEQNIKVPLIIKFPKPFVKHKVVERQVCLVDILPTILEIAGIGRPSYVQGESLMPFLGSSGRYRSRHAFPGNFTIRDDEWKLICYDDKRDSCELYNLKNDPGESKNLVKANPGKFKLLERELIKFIKAATPLTAPRKSADLSETQKRRLKSLGYLQ